LIYGLWLAVSFVSRPVAAAEAAPSAAELEKIVSAAAAYESGSNIEPLRQLEGLVARSTAEPAWRKDLEAGLARLLAGSSTYEAKRFACQQLAIVGAEGSLPALAALLKNDETAGIACLALSSIPSPKAGEVLRNALPSLQGAALVQAINALAARQDAPAVKPLTALTSSSELPVAQAAIVALGKIADEPARKALAALRRQHSPALAHAVAEASLRAAEKCVADGDRGGAASIYEELLLKLDPRMAQRYGLPQATQPDFVRRGALAALLQLDMDGGERRILSLLASKDEALIPVAIAGVRSLPSKRASAIFALELPKLSAQHQVFLIQALAERGDAAARVAILGRLNADEPAVRLAAINAIGGLGDASSAAPLVKALAGAKDTDERQAVEAALVSLGGKAATDQALVAELKPAPAEAKAPLMLALAKRGVRTAVPALMQEAASSDPAVAKAAFRALGSLATGEELPALLRLLVNLQATDARQEAEDAAALLVAKVKDPARRADTVCDVLARTTDVEARGSLLRLLPACGGARALAVLNTALAGPEPRLREAAFRALTDWPDLTAWDTLAGAYRQPENEAHRMLALRALTRLAGEENAKPTPTLIEHYRQMLAGAKTDDDRKLILGALAGATDPEALNLALELHANQGVRAEAAQAVKKIADAIKDQHPQAAQAALEKIK
jgi:HEAT repeat protein